MKLRAIIRQHLEAETLQKYLKDEYSTASNEKKRELLDLVKDAIDLQIDQIISAFLVEIKKGSPDAIRGRKVKIFIGAISVIASAGLAHAVNIENSVYILIMCAILLSGQGLNIYYD